MLYLCFHNHSCSGATDDYGETHLDIATWNGHTELADYLKSLPQQCKPTTIMSIHSVVQYSYSLYTAAVTGDRNEENGLPPPKQNGDFLIPPPVTSDPLSSQQTTRNCYNSILRITKPTLFQQCAKLRIVCNYCLTSLVVFAGTSLTEEDSDALEKLLIDNKITVPPALRLLRFEQIQQLLRDKGHGDLAANLRTQLDEGK